MGEAVRAGLVLFRRPFAPDEADELGDQQYSGHSSACLRINLRVSRRTSPLNGLMNRQ